MDVDDLLKIGTDPAAWLEKSASLRRAADALWGAFWGAVLRWAPLFKAHDEAGDGIWHEAMDCLIAAKMLYGLAVEAAFKSAILRDAPTDVEFRMRAYGTGRIQQVELKKLGLSMGAGHDLVNLAELAGLFRRGDSEVFSTDSDYTAIRAILEDLGEVVIWRGRYPVPRRSGQSPASSPAVPAVASGHYLRDWLDKVLDFYHGDRASRPSVPLASE